MDRGMRDYNLRAQQKGKSQSTAATKSKNSEVNTTDSEQSTTTTTGAMTGDTSLHEERSAQGAAMGMVPPELASFMLESRASFTQLNGKLDKFMEEMSTMKADLANTNHKVSDLETGLTLTSDKVSSIENTYLPQLRSQILNKIEELDEKLILSEIHDRKSNLLIYGVQQRNEKENTYDVVHEVFVHFMGISKEEASRVPLVNAHRLPSSTRGVAESQRQPPAIIVRFVRMIDRDRLLYGFERRPRQHSPTSTQQPNPQPQSSPYSKVTIRTDLPPKMKKERGEVAHITVLTAGYTTIETSSAVMYQCYRSVPDRDASLAFGRSAPITTDKSPPSDQPHHRYSHIRVVNFPNSNNWPSDGFGPFYCEAVKDGREITRVTTFFQRSDAKFIASDGVFTQTVNVNDTGVVISMTNRYQPDDNGNVITWRKDGGDVLTQLEGQTNINFPNPIEISNQGIYEIFYGGERDQNRGGIYRLIVTECPAGIWGPPECYGICDNCYNGGVCDDTSGLCICPNNFMGKNCLEICRDNGGNKFGLNCEFNCSSRNLPTSCRGYLFCLPDPYGCSCDVGSQGLACDSDCDVGTYGPGCSQICHCADVSSCDPFSGICTAGGCQSGWSGNNCQIPDTCEAGYYGSQCIDKCHCMDDVSCDKTTGACPQKCALGYSVRDGQENCQGELFYFIDSYSISQRI
ncbi:uncharacterized protein LOC135155970 [Lytechinus pictus]|uniref:uncharacterized protein LOC135155970 n=1 Tax=Lytechinus pictus TaxID=7653 RepID=UPI0030BA202F